MRRAKENDTESTTAKAKDSGRQYKMEIGLRGRAMSIPKGILDIWYHNSEDAGWPIPEDQDYIPYDRPHVTAWAYGLEFVVRDESANGIFYVDYFDASFGEGYWDDRESGGEKTDFSNGDYLVPTKSLGIVGFGANYGYEIHMLRLDQTQGKFGMSLLLGGGLGMGFLVGQLEQWSPSGATTAYQRYDQGYPAEGYKKIPRFYPMVDINASLRFNIADRVSIRMEGGLHTMVYYGLSVGVAF